MKKFIRKLYAFAVVSLVFFFALFVFSNEVLAVGTFTVTSNADSGSGTLRDAVIRASSGDTIVFASTVNTIVLTSGEILINKSLTINGPGSNQLRVSGNETSRIFQISKNAKVTLSDITLEYGRSADSGGAIFNNGILLVRRMLMLRNSAIFGGAIYSNGNLTVESSTVYANRAQFGGGISVAASADQARFTNTTVSYNFATSDDGGGLTVRSRNLFVNHCTIVYNRATASYAAGGLQTFATNAFVGNSIISGNRSLQFNDVFGVINSEGFNIIEDPNGNNGQWDVADLLSVNPLLGALQYNNGGTTPTFAPLAGSPAIDAGDESNTTILDQTGASRLRGVNVDIGAVELQPIVRIITVQNGNDSGAGSLREAVANSQPGDIIEFAVNYISLVSPITINKGLVIRGPGANLLTVETFAGANLVQTLNISAGSKVRISGLKFGSFAVENHGSLFLTDVAFVKTAPYPYLRYAPVFSDAGSVTLNNCLVSDFNFRGGMDIYGGRLIINNSSVLKNSETNYLNHGGGIYFNGSVGRIKNSTIAQNRTQFLSGNFGGGIYAGGGILNLINTTIAANFADGAGSGIYAQNGAFVSLTNCTVTENLSYSSFGAIYSQSNIQLKNTIVANNSNIFPAQLQYDVNGYVISAGHNLIGQVGLSAGYLSTDLLNVNPLLLPLGNYGGTTLTTTLQQGSPAINAGDNFLIPRTDQRGFTRVFVGNRVDIGACEYP